MKTGRNATCPCGSGRKFKRCCGKSNTGAAEAESSRNVVGILAEDGGTNIIFKEGFIINQLGRDAPRIAQSFDRLCEADLVALDKYASRCFFTTYVGTDKAKTEGKEWREACGGLVMNALSTLVAAIDLMRDGFILQPGVLIRTLLEVLTAVLCIVVDKEHWRAFQVDRLRPEAEIATATKVLPVFGPLYGLFSGQFTHVRQFYAQVQPVIDYESRDYEPLAANIRFARMALWLIYVVTELVFYEVSRPIYWRALGGGKYEFVQTAEGQALERELFREDMDVLGFSGQGVSRESGRT